MKYLRLAAILTAAIVGVGIAPRAYAQDAPPGWTLLGSETVRYFVPGSSPPANADQATGAQATSLAQGTNLGSNGEWILVGTETVRDFLPDDGTGNARLVSKVKVSSQSQSKNHQIATSVQVPEKSTRDTKVQEPNTAKWRLVTGSDGVRRFAVAVTQKVHVPICNRFHVDTWNVVGYDETFQEDRTVRTQSGDQIVDTRKWTQRETATEDYVHGSLNPALDQQVSEYLWTDRLPDEFYLADLSGGNQGSNTLGSSKSSLFLSDRSSGTVRTAVTGAAQRRVFRADYAVASSAQQAKKDSSTIDLGNDNGNGNGNGNANGNGNSGNGNSGSAGVNASAAASAAPRASAASIVASAQAVDPNLVASDDEVTIDSAIGTYRGPSGGSITVAQVGNSNNIRLVLTLANGSSATLGPVAFKKDYDIKFGLVNIKATFTNDGEITVSAKGIQPIVLKK